MTYKGRIGVLTGGGDVPGLNPAIRALTMRAVREGYQVVGIRRGWAGLVDIVRDEEADNSACWMALDEEVVNRYARAGGTFLHSSRTRPSAVPLRDVPAQLRGTYVAEKNDLTSEVLANLAFLGIDYLVPIGGDDTLSYGVELGRRGFPVVAIPKTMDNDVPGTDYCIGFSTCLTRTLSLATQVRSSAASHERIMVFEVFGRYAGFTALLPTLAGAADRCVIPESPFDISRLTELLVADRRRNPERFSAVLVSEGAMLQGGEMVFQGKETDQYGHAKLGGIGSQVSAMVKELSSRYNDGRKIDMISMNLSYLVRSGEPDALDSVVPLVYGNLAIDSILRGTFGVMVALRNGRYGSVPIDTVVASKKVVDVAKYYDADRYRPTYAGLELSPMLVVGGAG
ncbi:MAG: ATP-dependent 6-phosphofructokinase [Actinobacteria bacterium]|nr:ATP-dependent 6-phosphofructokinase [Actinomycetota bacterium]